MGRRIVVTSNCQTGGLHAALTAMLPQDTVVPLAWLAGEPVGLRDLLRDADVWVCSAPRALAQGVLGDTGARAKLISVPPIWFPAFHPDGTQVPTRTGIELDGPAGPYHSKIVVWSWAHGFDADTALARFRPETFAALGYLDAWQPAVDTLRGLFEPTDIDFREWLLPLLRDGVFMLTNNHPRLNALVQMARQIAALLGADASVLRYRWELVLPDGLLATSYVWPLYPGVGESLDLPGGYVWRLPAGELLGLAEFVERSFARYETVDPATLDLDHIDLDPRFADAFDRHGSLAVR